MIERIQLIRNIGQFDSVSSGGRIPLSKLTLIYAENGRGKTTLAAVLRSLGTGDPIPITERLRLAAANPPHVVITQTGGAPVVFENGAWSASLPDIAIFDDVFVVENVHAGLAVETEQRQKLHELILGAQGVELNVALQRHVERIEEHNRALRAKGDAIPGTSRGAMSVDAFCDLRPRDNIDAAIQEAERSLAAARSAEAVRTQAPFDAIGLPEFDTVEIIGLLGRTLADLNAAAAERVQAHLASLGAGGESWVGEGMKRIEGASAGAHREICPFCAQTLDGSALIAHYRAYFSAAYDQLKQGIGRTIATVNSVHGGEVVAAFERSIRVAIETRQFWSQFAEVPEITLDTAAIARAWKAAQERVLEVLRAKQSAPLDPATLPPVAVEAIAAFDSIRGQVAQLSDALRAVNDQIAVVKEKAAAANVATLAADLARLRAVQARYRPEIARLCDDYLAEKKAKETTEGLREQARAALDQYRKQIFPTYETAINDYLARFNAGFRLTQVTSVNTRGGSACSYNVLINAVPVPLSPGATPGPSFRNTLSAGDRNTLALAFFFAALDRDPRRAQKVVVIDDPISSLDEHRSLVTIQEVRRLPAAVDQVIVLSHEKPFLCAVWQGADTTTRSALKLDRDATGSTLAVWDVNQDSITEHDRRHRLVTEYLRTHNAAQEREVAQALRPILEAFMRVAYPETFPPGSLLVPLSGYVSSVWAPQMRFCLPQI